MKRPVLEVADIFRDLSRLSTGKLISCAGFLSYGVILPIVRPFFLIVP